MLERGGVVRLQRQWRRPVAVARRSTPRSSGAASYGCSGNGGGLWRWRVAPRHARAGRRRTAATATAAACGGGATLHATLERSALTEGNWLWSADALVASEKLERLWFVDGGSAPGNRGIGDARAREGVLAAAVPSDAAGVGAVVGGRGGRHAGA